MSSRTRQVVVAGSFDDMRSRHIRFLEEAAKFGELRVLLWNDDTARRLTGEPPKFPQPERQYLLQGIRYVSRVKLADDSLDLDSLLQIKDFKPQVWVLESSQDNPARKNFCAAHGIECRVLHDEDLRGFPEQPSAPRERDVYRSQAPE